MNVEIRTTIYSDYNNHKTKVETVKFGYRISDSHGTLYVDTFKSTQEVRDAFGKNILIYIKDKHPEVYEQIKFEKGFIYDGVIYNID